MQSFSFFSLLYTARRKTFPGMLEFWKEFLSCYSIEKKVFSISFPLLYTIRRKTFPGTLEFSGIFCARAIGKRFLFRFPLILYIDRTKTFPGTLGSFYNPQQKSAKSYGLTYATAPEKKIKRKSLGGEEI